MLRDNRFGAFVAAGPAKSEFARARSPGCPTAAVVCGVATAAAPPALGVAAELTGRCKPFPSPVIAASEAELDALAGWEAAAAVADVATWAAFAVRGVGEPMLEPVLGVSFDARRRIAAGAGAFAILVDAMPAAVGASEAAIDVAAERCTVDDEASMFRWPVGAGVALSATFGAELATSGREVVRGCRLATGTGVCATWGCEGFGCWRATEGVGT